MIGSTAFREIPLSVLARSNECRATRFAIVEHPDIRRRAEDACGVGRDMNRRDVVVRRALEPKPMLPSRPKDLQRRRGELTLRTMSPRL